MSLTDLPGRTAIVTGAGVFNESTVATVEASTCWLLKESRCSRLSRLGAAEKVSGQVFVVQSDFGALMAARTVEHVFTAADGAFSVRELTGELDLYFDDRSPGQAPRLSRWTAPALGIWPPRLITRPPRPDHTAADRCPVAGTLGKNKQALGSLREYRTARPL